MADFISFHRPQIMGILNITEDSFSDGNLFVNPEDAIAQAIKMIESGADIIDIGAESTRPGAKSISAELELKRIEPVLKSLMQMYPDAYVSIDTQKSEVAQRCIELGARMINDISALCFDPKLGKVLADNPHIAVVLMHMQGTPETMQINPSYADVESEVREFLESRAQYALEMGILPQNIVLDPGIGFGKTLEHNLKLLSALDRLGSYPILLGASRKSFIGKIHPSGIDERVGGTLATSIFAAFKKVKILRVHDVAEHVQFFDVLSAICEKG